MSWCKFDDAADGEKMALAASAVGDAAIAFWFRAVLHCSRNRTDGFVDARLIGRFTSHKKPLAVVAALVDARVRPDGAGLLVPCDGGWMVHDYLRFNRSRAEAEAEDERVKAEKDAAKDRAKAARDAKRTVYNQPVRSANVRPDISQDETVPYENVPRASPRASPVPSRPVPSHAAIADAGGEGSGGALDMSDLRRLWNENRERVTGSMLPAIHDADANAVLATLPKVRAAAPRPKESFADWLAVEFDAWHAETTKEHGANATRITRAWSPVSFAGWYELHPPPAEVGPSRPVQAPQVPEGPPAAKEPAKAPLSAEERSALAAALLAKADASQRPRASA